MEYLSSENIMLTDDQINELCAQALKVRAEMYSWYDEWNKYHSGKWNPVDDQKLALELIKRFEINIGWETERKVLAQPSRDEYDPEIFTVSDEYGNVARVVALCVAIMHKHKDKITPPESNDDEHEKAEPFTGQSKPLPLPF